MLLLVCVISIHFECTPRIDLQLRASSAVYFTMTSALPSWNSRNDSKMMSP